MAVLIVGDPADSHVSAMVWALDEYGTDAVIWHQGVKAGSVRLDSASVDYRLSAENGGIAPASIHAVWVRRRPEPELAAGFREGDRIASRDALAAHHEGLLELLPGGILWANPLADRRSASFTLKQLAEAVSVGLPIRTIATDDAGQARSFVASQPEMEVVRRPLRAIGGRGPARTFHHSAAAVDPAELDDSEMLARSPSILQGSVPGACCLRVAIFGRTCVSAKILDQDPAGRGARPLSKVVPYDLPDAVERKLHALMERLGLVTAMVELAVTPEGDHVFVELDEQGQFLWLEDMCPELPLVDIAARFLACADPYFRVDVVAGFGLKYANFPGSGLDEFAGRGNGFPRASEGRYSSACN